MIKKTVIMALYILGMTLFAAGCTSSNSRQVHVSNNLNIDKNQIKKISISAFSGRFKEVDITDSNQISNVIDYLISIKPVTTNKNPANYVGDGYLIKIQFKDNSERVFNHVGNMFFMEEGKFTYEMQYEEAAKINTIVASILESNMEKYGDGSITGTIITMYSQESGRNVWCVVRDQDNATYNVSVLDASIIDSTGRGRMILFENDKVEIYYKKDKQVEKNKVIAYYEKYEKEKECLIMATTVFIK